MTNEEPNEIDQSTSDQELPDIATTEPIKRKKRKFIPEIDIDNTEIDIDNSNSNQAKKPKYHTDEWLPNLNLDKTDKDILLNNQQLTDNHMTAASSLLKKQFPNINGMQSTLYITNQNKCITIGK